MAVAWVPVTAVNLDELGMSNLEAEKLSAGKRGQVRTYTLVSYGEPIETFFADEKPPMDPTVGRKMNAAGEVEHPYASSDWHQVQSLDWNCMKIHVHELDNWWATRPPTMKYLRRHGIWQWNPRCWTRRTSLGWSQLQNIQT